VSYFNSTLVRLKVRLGKEPGIITQFQFHFGTIERTIPAIIYPGLSDISIPLWYDWKALFSSSFIIAFDFNSTLVRLKVTASPYVIHQWQFQFHFGTIESRNSIKRSERFVNFNSTLVRLKVLITSPGASPLPWFQFHFGTIERQLRAFENNKHIHFNSTLVRLKVFIAAVTILPILDFNSTLVRLKDSYLLPYMPHQGISIPLWYDWKYINKNSVPQVV